MLQKQDKLSHNLHFQEVREEYMLLSVHVQVNDVWDF